MSDEIKFPNKTSMANSLGVSRTTIRAWAAKGDFPAGPPWKLDEVVPWIVGRQQKKQPTDDPLLDGPDSPALERYRAARASLSEMELEERKAGLVSMDAFVEWFSTELAAPIRRAIVGLQLRFGVDATAALERAIDKAEHAVEERRPSDVD